MVAKPAEGSGIRKVIFYTARDWTRGYTVRGVAGGPFTNVGWAGPWQRLNQPAASEPECGRGGIREKDLVSDSAYHGDTSVHAGFSGSGRRAESPRASSARCACSCARSSGRGGS